MATRLKPLKKGDDMSPPGELASRENTQYTQELRRKFDIDKFRGDGYLLDARDIVNAVEAIEKVLSLNVYKRNPAKRQGFEKTREKILHVLIYDTELLKQEGELRMHERMLPPIKYDQRQEYKRKMAEIGEEVPEHLEPEEHVNITIVLNLGDRRPLPATGEIDTIETSASQ